MKSDYAIQELTLRIFRRYTGLSNGLSLFRTFHTFSERAPSVSLPEFTQSGKILLFCSKKLGRHLTQALMNRTVFWPGKLNNTLPHDRSPQIDCHFSFRFFGIRFIRIGQSMIITPNPSSGTPSYAPAPSPKRFFARRCQTQGDG